ncbi:MAG: hypothetical protein CL833_10725 [Crocinitomicaceae bacterium]|nr:hypothetical protein [Crocinitomicaceae bacterium]
MRKRSLLFLLITFTIPNIFGQCLFFDTLLPHPTASSMLDLNSFQTTIANGSLNHLDYIGKTDLQSPLYRSTFWIGGMDASNNIYFSGGQYYSENSFSPGPLRTNGTTEWEISDNFNRTWKINRWEVQLFRDWFLGNISVPNYTIPESILSYPGNGNASLGYAHMLAPFHDHNNDGIYNPNDGDYPEFDLDGVIGCGDKLYGDQCIFWIMNDLRPNSNNVGSSLQVEVHCQAFAYVGSESLNNTTFMRYKIINRSPIDYHDVYIGNWFDGDLGRGTDDRIESDVPRSLAIVFNGDSLDELNYGLHPPAFGIDVLRGPGAIPFDGLDNDYDGLVDEADEMNLLSFFKGLSADMPDPTYASGIDYYNAISTSIDYDSTGILTSHTYPGHSDTAYWYSTNGIDPGSGGWFDTLPPGDRRMLGSTGPFSISSGDSVEQMLALVWARDLNGNHIDSKEKLRLVSDTIQDFSDNCMSIACPELYSDFGVYQERTNFVFTPIQEAISYSWDFGDGTSSTNKYGIHTYTESDTFNVCLNASNACSSVSVCKEIFLDAINFNLPTFPVQRIQGTGNGGWDLEIMDTCIQSFELSGNNIIEHPIYKPNHSPIRVELIEPSMVDSGTYQLKMYPSGGWLSPFTWKMYRIGYTDTVYADTNISIYNRQLIPQWGIAVTINPTNYTQPFSSFIYTPPITSDVNYEDPTKDWLGFIEDEDILGPTNWILSGTRALDTDPATYPNYCCDPASQNDYVGIDDIESYETLLGGGASPYRLVSRRCPGSIVAQDFMGTLSANDFNFLASIDLVFTNDTTLWTRCAVVETHDTDTLSIGHAKKQYARMSNSVNKSGNPDGTGIGMGWFPGYALNVETGERLNIAFGEDSGQPMNNGTDMIWNPSDIKYDSLGNPVFGGKHPIFIFGKTQIDSSFFNYMPMYDGGVFLESYLADSNSANSATRNKVWRSCMYVLYPILKPGRNILETRTRVRLRVSKPYERFGWPLSSYVDNGVPIYNILIDTSNASNSINEQDILNTRIYPNPTSDVLNISFENLTNEKFLLTMVDITGKIIHAGETNRGGVQLSLLGLKDGIYIVYVHNKNGSKISSSKVIKTR